MILTYHEITAAASAYSYSTTAGKLDEHLALLASLRREHTEEHYRVVTFDDGHASQHRFGLPALEKHGCQGIFFVTAGWTEVRPEYMTWSQLRELAGAGHQVQAHGWEHALLTHCSDQQLRTELERPRKTLEDRLGTPVDALSAPGGRWDARVVRACSEAGYRRLYTSNPWMGTGTRSGVQLAGRFMVRRTTTAADIGALFAMRGPRLWLAKSARAAKDGAKKMMGDRLYQRLWDVLASSSDRQAIHDEYRGGRS